MLLLLLLAVRALLRHGASLSARTTAPTLSNSPTLHPPGSTALHFAATAEDMSLVLVLLEAQVSHCRVCASICQFCQHLQEAWDCGCFVRLL